MPAWRRALVCFFVISLLALAHASDLLTVEQLGLLTASDGADGDLFGRSVAISGNTIVVGASAHDDDTGEAYVFVRPRNGWENATQSAKLTASDGQFGDEFGNSVAIDGDVIVVGAPGAMVNGIQQGAAYVFVKPAHGWTNMTETAKLIVPDASTNASVGESATISGSTIVLGAPQPEGITGPGAAYVFVEPAGGWTDMTQTATLTSSDGANGDYFGNAVTISGNVIAVGAEAATYSNEQGPGAVYVFVEPPNGWVDTIQTAKLTASNGLPEDALGYSVSIYGDTIVAGAILANSSEGAVYVFVEPKAGWQNTTETAEFELTTFQLGVSVAVTGNGSTIAAGAIGTHPMNYVGAVYVFVRPAGGWKSTSKFNLEVQGHPKKSLDYFAFSLSISGTTGVVGAQYAPYSNDNEPGPGIAYVFGP